MRENIKVALQQIKEYESVDWSSILRRPLLYGMSEFHSA
jgi:hypothetical protein